MKSKGKSVSYSTIQRRAKEGKQGLKCRKIVKKPFLSDKQIEQRIKFANANKGIGWKYIVFSDSSKFNFVYKDRASGKRMWVKPGTQPYIQCSKS
jgi:hypothetical protein